MSIPQEKIVLLEKSKLELDNLTNELRKRGYTLAVSEREYRKALSIKEIELRSKGNSYPANMAIDIAKGTPGIAELRYKRDIAKIDYDICKDKLRNERSNIEAIRSLLSWDRANYMNS